MRRMIPQKLINAIKALLPFSNKVKYVGDQVKIEADVEVEGLTSKGIANTGALANTGDGSFAGNLTGKSVKSTNVIQLNASAIPSEDFDVVEATCEVINERCHLYRILLHVKVTQTQALTFANIIPAEARPSRTWIGQYLPNTSVNTLRFCRISDSGNIVLYTAGEMIADHDCEICVLSLW